MYSLFDLNIRAVIRELVDYIKVKVPASPEASLKDDTTNQSSQKSVVVDEPQLLTLEVTLEATPTPEDTPHDTLETEPANQTTEAVNALTETQELQNALEAATANTRN
jgi:ABC-type uncharacterized transport system involved in gliding motility auxiliary subunit